MLFVRATFAFLALPTVVAGLVPALIVWRNAPAHNTAGFGIALLGAGGCLLLWCVRDFFVSGKGTLAPWDPPRHLVIVGLYRYVRNPRYLAVLVIIAGWSLAYASAWLVVYLVFLATAFHLRVRLYEEPWLRREFCDEWKNYADSVSRWLPHPSKEIR